MEANKYIEVNGTSYEVELEKPVVEEKEEALVVVVITLVMFIPLIILILIPKNWYYQ